MNSEQIQEHVYLWAQTKNFSAPYGVLSGQHTNRKGTTFRSVTFGRARTLDAIVEIYNRKFMIVRTNKDADQVFKNVQDLMQYLNTL